MKPSIAHEHRPHSQRPTTDEQRQTQVPHRITIDDPQLATIQIGRQTNRLSDLDHRGVGDVLGAFSAHFEEAIYVLTRELGSSLAERREPLDHPLGEQLLLVVAADLGLPA